MSAFLVSNNTIDLIVQAAFKYKVITKRQRTLFGQQLWAANQQSMFEKYGSQGELEPTFTASIAAYPAYTAFPRKFKRAAVSGAIACFNYQSCEAAGWATSEVKRLLDIVAEKNAVKAGYRAATEWTPTLDDDGNVVMSTEPEGWNEDYDGEFFPEQQGTYEVTQTASAKYRAAIDAAPDDAFFWDITDDQRNPDIEADNSVMVRPIETIRAERAVERERILAERTALSEADAADRERILAERTAEEALDNDEDDDEWDDVDDEFEDDDEG